MNKAVKVENSSIHWKSNEAELYVYLTIRWDSDHNKSYLRQNAKEFLRKYCSLTHKWGMAKPVVPISDIDNYESDSLTKWFFNLYNLDGKFVSISELYIQPESEMRMDVVNIDPIILFSDVSEYHSMSSFPVRVELLDRFDELYVQLYFDHDAFLAEIDNSKTKAIVDILGADNWVDNMSLALKNTPRLNSFIRDLKELCFEFKANEVDFENELDVSCTEDGILLNTNDIQYGD